MICLCCGKPIKDPQKANNGWHNTCIKRFFGTKELPELNLSADTIESIANECTRRGFTVPGVQKKLSLHLSNEKMIQYVPERQKELGARFFWCKKPVRTV